MKGPKPRPVADRFWSKVDRSGGPDACWPWLGCRLPFGYGQFYLPNHRAKGPARTHEVAWGLTYQGPVLPGSSYRHIVCDFPPCCNPEHVYPGTQAENIGDMLAHGREARGERSGS